VIIWGNSISTNTSRPDYAETNEELASFIKNKPDAAIQKAQDTADNANTAAGNAKKAADDAQKTADSKVAQITAEIVLTASGWSGERQTVAVEGVTTINTVFIAPVPASIEPFGYYEITCVKQGNGNLTFSCEGEPDTDITLNVVILDVTVSPESGNPAVPGEDGGYYIPRVTQIDATTVRFEFTPSETDMPAVDPVTVTLPAGTGGGGSADLTGYATEAWVQAGYQPKGDYPLRSELPSVPVQSVNGKTGAVQLTAEDVSARPSSWMPTAAEVGALPNTYKPPNQTAQQVGADPAGTASSAVSAHNANADSHQDLRIAVAAINDRLNAFFDSDDQTLDELSEIVDYITSNKSLIDAITTSKVNVLDIVNNLVTNVPTKPLSAAQGVALKGLIDTVSSSLANYLPTSQLSSAIDAALAQAKETGDFDGPAGQRGTGILNTTTGIASYTTAVGGVSPKYRILLSTLKTQAKVNEVLVGDTVRYSTFLYPVIYVDSEYAYMTTRVTIQGTAGTSVTVESVTESSESGGNNVVTFSDNKALTVKNGKDGHDPVRGTDYWTEADQEAIVQQVITALGTPVFGRVEEGNKITLSIEHLADGTYYLGYEGKDGNWVGIGTLNNVPAPTYTNVLTSAINADGTPFVGANGEKGYKTNTRLSSSGAESTSNATGLEVTGFIAVAFQDRLYFKDVEVIKQGTNSDKCYFTIYDSSFGKIADRRMDGTGEDGAFTWDENNNIKSLYLNNNGGFSANIDNAAYLRFSATEINASSIITRNEPIH
jgi:hypothetical protein